MDELSIIDRLKGLSASPVHNGNSKLHIARRTKGAQCHCEALCAAGVLHGSSGHAGMREEAGFMGFHPNWTNPLHGEARRENERVVGGGRERGGGWIAVCATGALPRTPWANHLRYLTAFYYGKVLVER